MKSERESWDDWWLKQARSVSTRSKDPSTKVGCWVVSPDNRRSTFGYNGFPSRIEDREEWLNDRGVKYSLIVHAEQNCLDIVPWDVTGWTLYVTRHPCSECAKRIVNKGIVRVVYEMCSEYELRVSEDLKKSRWIFKLAGVVVERKRV